LTYRESYIYTISLHHITKIRLHHKLAAHIDCTRHAVENLWIRAVLDAIVQRAFLFPLDNNNIKIIRGRERERERGAEKTCNERSWETRRGACVITYSAAAEDARAAFCARGVNSRAWTFYPPCKSLGAAPMPLACNGLRSRLFSFSNPMIVIRTMNMFIRNLPRDRFIATVSRHGTDYKVDCVDYLATKDFIDNYV